MTTATAEAPESPAAPEGKHTHADVFPELMKVHIQHIDRSRNHRIPHPKDDERIQSLMKSIQTGGLQTPVRVYQAHKEGERLSDEDSLYILGFGWRRCEAMSRLGHELIRAEVYPWAPDHEIEAARAIENIHRQDITPIEEARAVADILAAYQEEHPTATKREAIEHAAAETGRTVSWIRDRDYFTRLAAPVRELANKVAIPAGHLLELAKVGDEQLQLDIALDTVGLAPHWFEDGTLKPDNVYGVEHVEEFFADAAAGVVRIDKLDQVKKRVADAQRSLKSVPWVLELPVLVSGKTALPACDECLHNTANDLTLFGIEGEAGSGGPAHGTCMSPVCYSAKKEASEKAREKPLKQLLRMNNPAAKLAAKVEQAPDWLDKKKLKGFLSRKIKASSSESGQPVAASTQQRAHSGQRTPTPHEKALGRFEKAVQKWETYAADQILQLSSKTSVGRASLRLFGFARPVEDLPEVNVPHVYLWGEPATDTPDMPAGDLPLDVQKLIGLVADATAESACKLTDVECVRYEPLELQHYPTHPELFIRLHQAFGGDELPAFPAWEDFAPKPKADKPAPKKKATRKKPTKKKPVAKRVKKSAASK